MADIRFLIYKNYRYTEGTMHTKASVQNDRHPPSWSFKPDQLFLGLT